MRDAGRLAAAIDVLTEIETRHKPVRMALKNFAKDGRDPAKALLETIDAIKKAKSTAEANTLAFQVFGVRAGPDLAAAIREGRFELDAFIRAMGSGDTIGRAADDAEDLGDKLGMLKNRLVAALGRGELRNHLRRGAAHIQHGTCDH